MGVASPWSPVRVNSGGQDVLLTGCPMQPRGGWRFPRLWQSATFKAHNHSSSPIKPESISLTREMLPSRISPRLFLFSSSPSLDSSIVVVGPRAARRLPRRLSLARIASFPTRAPSLQQSPAVAPAAWFSAPPTQEPRQSGRTVARATRSAIPPQKKKERRGTGAGIGAIMDRLDMCARGSVSHDVGGKFGFGASQRVHARVGHLDGRERCA